MNVAQLILAQAADLYLSSTSGAGNDLPVYPMLLLSVLPVVVALGLFMILKHAHSRKRATGQAELREKRPFHPFTFSPPNRWLAIKSGNPHVVLAALGLHNPAPCSWEEGLGGSPDHKLFISPPIAGWILVLGPDLPDPADDVDENFRFIVDLSRKLGLVQFFSANRSINAHAWAQASHGQVIRAYAWAGKTLWNQGKVTAAERELGLKCFDYAEGTERSDFARSEAHRSNAEKVTRLAACWSIDPTGIDARMIHGTLGLVGDLSHSKHR